MFLTPIRDGGNADRTDKEPPAIGHDCRLHCRRADIEAHKVSFASHALLISYKVRRPTPAQRHADANWPRRNWRPRVSCESTQGTQTRPIRGQGRPNAPPPAGFARTARWIDSVHHGGIDTS